MAPPPTPAATTEGFLRFRDPRFSIMSVWIEPGEHYVTDDPDEMIATVLGSCVAACIRDPVAGIGGMNHFMLPERDEAYIAVAAAPDMRYGTVAMQRLIADILARGGQRDRLEIKVFGGSTMIGRGGVVGPRNADFVEQYLQAAKLRLAGGDLRGDDARRILYFPSSGRALMQLLPRLPQDAGVADRDESCP
jgi:chemotaxis protein CheD